MTLSSSFWSRIRGARLLRVFVVYGAACWAILQATSLLRQELDLPRWLTPVAIVLLAIGLVIVTATAWVQSHPLTAARERKEEIPASWEIDLGEARESVARGRLPHLTWARAVLGGVVAFSLLFGLAGIYVLLTGRGHSSAPEEALDGGAAPGIAVLPFSVRGSGVDVWREGMVDVLSTNLDGIAGLRAIDSRTVLARWRERVPGAQSPDLQTSLDVARTAGARYAVIGNALETGSSIRFAADVYDVESRKDLGEGEVAGSPDSVLSLVNGLSIEILRTIAEGTPGDLSQVDLARVTTSSVSALKAYLGAEALFRRSDFEGAIPLYERAVQADSTFALAFYRLSDAYGWATGIAGVRGASAIERAARLANRLSERDASLVRAVLALGRGEGRVLQLVNRLVGSYPDDVEAWYLMGDAYNHLGNQVLARRELEEKAFARAIELDSTFTPAYIHPIENAFARDDSNTARRLVNVYSRLARGSRPDIENRVALGLAFGDSAGAPGPRLELDTLAVDLEPLWTYFAFNPRLLALAEEVITRARHAPGVEPFIARRVLYTLLARGRAQAALRQLSDPLLARPYVYEGSYILQAAGMVVPDNELEAALTQADTGDVQRVSDPRTGGFDVGPFYVGALAAERGRWPDHAAAVSSLRDEARRLSDADTVGSRFMHAAAAALEAYGSWRRGEPESAIRGLEAALSGTTGYFERESVNQTIRWWLGHLHLESGRPREAARYFESLEGGKWPALIYLGKAYEEGGEPTRAKRAYELFAIAWRDADPQLRPRIDEARAAARRLTSAIEE